MPPQGSCDNSLAKTKHRNTAPRATRPFRHPQLFGNVVSCFSIYDSCDSHVGSHNKTSQGHVVIVCLIFNRVQAAGAVDLGALQSTPTMENHDIEDD